MGCGSSVAGVNTGPKSVYVVQVNEVWIEALKTIDDQIIVKPSRPKAPKVKKMSNLVIRRSGWKTVRIFVSSTFKDFHSERDILVKKVFPDLRLWCESRRIHLVECDLRWGIPKDSTTEETLRTCLGEIDRCYQDNVMPFFLNMTSHRTGWVPEEDEVPGALSYEYRWVNGLSITEMEIMHGAFRKGNPNALFMLRDPSFLKDVPEEHKRVMEEQEPVPVYKQEILRSMIKDRFQNVVVYKCEYDGIDEESKQIELAGLDATFSTSVYEFFKKRIESQYPLPDMDLDPLQIIKEKHESFMKSRGQKLFGREELLKQIQDYVCGPGVDVPLLIQGGPGTGKSSVMANIADSITMQALSKDIPGGGEHGWHVFYHFVGALPGSTELLPLIQRLLKEMEAVNDTTMPMNMEEAVVQSISGLSHPNTRPTIVIIDALNQLDEDNAVVLMNWIPKKLAPHVRCIFSLIPDTPPHKALVAREPMPQIIDVQPLDLKARKALVEEMLAVYNKRLDEQQMTNLLEKEAAVNPLWLSIACEELRVFGMFRQLNDKINQLADGLLELEMQVMTRFEEENGGSLVVATLCLLETSVRGLLETELLSILVDEDNLTYEKPDSANEKDDSRREKSASDLGKLPAFKWAAVYRALRPFIRPFGDSGEGRLDFYHRSFSKAVRKKYLSKEDGTRDPDRYKFWHRKLADFFQGSVSLDRKFEEFPEHLVAIDDMQRLQEFLSDWDVIENWVNDEFSFKLISFWRKAGGFEAMESCYMEKINNYLNSPRKLITNWNEVELRYEKLGHIFSQTGRWEKAREMAAKAKDIETKNLGARPDRMLEINHLTACIEDEFLKLEGFMYRSQLPQIKVIIDGLENVRTISKTLSGDKYKFKQGVVANRLAFHYTGWRLRGGNSELSKADARAKGIAAVEEAINIFTELKDQAHVGDCLTTRGVCEGNSTPQQIKYYKEAEEIILQTMGPLNVCMDRLLLNMAIYYEEIGEHNMSYDKFYKWYELCTDLYGLKHPKTARCVDTLREPMYQNMAREAGRAVPDPVK